MTIIFDKDKCEHLDECISLLEDMVEGRVSYIEGADAMIRWFESQGLSIFDSNDFYMFLLIQSETDALPRHAQRKLWSEQALKDLEGKISESEEWAKQFAEADCRNLLRRLTAT